MRTSLLLLAVSAVGALFGAWLIGTWAVGTVIVAVSLAVGVHALLRDIPNPPLPKGAVEATLERFRRAP